MAISIKKYVEIVSAVGAGVGVRRRELIGRIFTTNPLVPTNAFVEFTNVEDVGTYFGTTSEEYQRASMYFAFISKQVRRAEKISFARWVDQDSAPRIYGRVGAQSLTALQAITAGAFTLSIGGVDAELTGLDFSAALSLSDVASAIQTAIRAEGGTQFANATVTWDAVRQSFNLVGDFNGEEEITVTAGAANDVAGQIGWLDGAIYSDGASSETVVETLTASADASNNFGSFAFIPALTLEQWQEVGLWNTTRNVEFWGMVPVLPADATAWSEALAGEFWGLALTLAPLADEYPEQIPMIILAATDYTRRSASQNYMFQQFGNVTPSVSTTMQSDAYDAQRINYYGRTQTAGQVIEFYQRGILTGEGNAPVDMNVYANEMWLKDEAAAACLELQLNLTRISANSQGRAQLRTALQNAINLALFNGTISIGKPLNTTQKLFIAQITGDDLAWQQIQNIGYWLDVVMQSYVTGDGRTEWKAVYTLVYSKDDVVRKIDGSHILI